MINDQQQIMPVAVKPLMMPLIALMMGLFVWLADAIIDVYWLGEEQDLLTNILMPDEASELWMRVLVVAVFVIMGLHSRFVLIKHIKLDSILLDYQQKLEATVELRTRELINKTEELEMLASTDPLTGLYNRRKFNHVLKSEMSRFQRYGQPLCLLLADIDNFKLINDTHGHDVGDDVLTAFAILFNQNVRETDSVARWGGEEFMVLTIESDLPKAKIVAEKLVKAIREMDFSVVGKVTASIGVTVIEAGDSIETLSKRADQALYTAKNKGRDCVVCYESSNKLSVVK